MPTLLPAESWVPPEEDLLVRRYLCSDLSMATSGTAQSRMIPGESQTRHGGIPRLSPRLWTGSTGSEAIAAQAEPAQEAPSRVHFRPMYVPHCITRNLATR